MTFQDDHRLETYKSLIAISVDGFKTLLLINGGAVVAMLAYLGQASRGPEVAQHARLPLVFFILGIMTCVLAFFGSYRTQLALYGESVSAKPQRHPIFLNVTAGFALSSAILFACGALSGVSVVAKYSTPSSKTASTLAQPPFISSVVNCR